MATGSELIDGFQRAITGRDRRLFEEVCAVDVHYEDPFTRVPVKGITLLGNSLGGAVSLGYALAYPDEVSRLILMAPGGVEVGPLALQPVAGPTAGNRLGGDRSIRRGHGASSVPGPAGSAGPPATGRSPFRP